MDNDVNTQDLRTFGRAFATCSSQAAADAWCQAARRVARSISRPYRTWGHSIGTVWYVNAVIEDWSATTAERRALREWEERNNEATRAVNVPPGAARKS